jgi:hypothetical protein
MEILVCFFESCWQLMTYKKKGPKKTVLKLICLDHKKSLICSDHIGRSHKLTYKSVIATYKVWSATYKRLRLSLMLHVHCQCQKIRCRCLTDEILIQYICYFKICVLFVLYWIVMIVKGNKNTINWNINQFHQIQQLNYSKTFQSTQSCIMRWPIVVNFGVLGVMRKVRSDRIGHAMFCEWYGFPFLSDTVTWATHVICW